MTWRPTVATLFLEKAAAPTADDDQNEGYLVGDIWVDETNDAAYLNLDVTVGAAVWKHISLEEAAIDHTAILNIGTTTHADIDTHIGDTTIHFDQVGELSDVVITGPADNDLLQYDTGTSKWVDRTLAEAGISAAGHTHDDRYFTEAEHLDASAGAGDAGKPIKLDAAGHVDASMVNDGDVDHTAITNIGTNSHADIDTHIGDGTKHFLEGAIDHGSISGLAHSADHAWALLIDASRALTANWYMGTFNVGVNDDTNTEKLNVGGNLMLSGAADRYIKGDTKDAGDDSAFYVQGAGTDVSNLISMGTGATSKGKVVATYGGSLASSYVQMYHNGAIGIIETGAGSLTLKAANNIVTIDAAALFAVKEIRATDGNGLALKDDGGNLGVFVEDGGHVGIGMNDPRRALHILGSDGVVGAFPANVGVKDFLLFENNGNSNLGFVCGADDSSYFKFYESGVDNWLGLIGYQALHNIIELKQWETDGNQAGMVIDVSNRIGINTGSPTAKLDINSDILRLRTAKTPVTAGAAGNAGDICWDATYIYVCVATNTWERVQHDSW